MAASIPWHRPLFLRTKPDPPNYRFTTARISRTSTFRAFHRSDFDGFARRVTSGEALRDAWRSANEGIEQLVFEARRAAERIDRRYAVSRRIGSAARAAASRAQEIDYEMGISRRWRYFSMDFSRNWPRYRRELNGFLQTPIGRGSMVVPNAKKKKSNVIDPELEEKLHRMFGGVVTMDNHSWAPSERRFGGIAEHVDAEQTIDSNEGLSSNFNKVESTSRSKRHRV